MPSERSKPSEITGENAARSNVRSISLATCCRPFCTTTSVTGSIMRTPSSRPARRPRAAVLAAEERAKVTLEVCATGHPDRPRLPGDLADVAAVRLALRIQRLEASARPVAARIRAAEEAGAPDGEDHPRPPAADEDAVHVHGIVVDVLAVAHVFPVLAAVETADDTADLDGAVELAGVGGIGGQPQHALGRVGAGRDADFGEAHGDGELPPVLAAVGAPEDLAVLVARVHHVRVAQIEQQRPHGQAVILDIEPLPVLPVIRAAVHAG